MSPGCFLVRDYLGLPSLLYPGVHFRRSYSHDSNQVLVMIGVQVRVIRG